jgi:hypothetical protein
MYLVSFCVVEVCLHSISVAGPAVVRDKVIALLEAVHREKGSDASYVAGPLDLSRDPFLAKHVHHARICDIVAPSGWNSDASTAAYASAMVSSSGAATGSAGAGKSASAYLPSAPYWNSEVAVFVYQLNEDGPSSETAGDGDTGRDGGGSGEVQTQYTQWSLPAAEFEGTWEALLYEEDEEDEAEEAGSMAIGGRAVDAASSASSTDSAGLSHPPAAKRTRGNGDLGGIAEITTIKNAKKGAYGEHKASLQGSHLKPSLLQYAASALLFSDAGVNTSLVSWNSVVLLHGPPGTGKTSLCKALAHKLAIRFAARYPTAQLIEINAHSLFSRWFRCVVVPSLLYVTHTIRSHPHLLPPRPVPFLLLLPVYSESGKLVHRLFGHIAELVADEESLVCLLIDEVESLTAARRANSNEPSDAVRTVNAVLTAIDGFRTKRNVLLLTTSNVSDAIDVAFVDRADIKAFVGPPGAKARYDIIASCVSELARVGVVKLGPVADAKGATQSSGKAASGITSISSTSSSSAVTGRTSATAQSASFSNGGGTTVYRLGTAAEAKIAASVVATAAAARASSGAAAHAMDTETVAPTFSSWQLPDDVDVAASASLWTATQLSQGFSGRTLRKLPLQAHAMHVRAPRCSGQEFAAAIIRAVTAERAARADFKDL